MKTWKRRMGILLLCLLLAAPQMTVYADRDEDDVYSDEASDDEIADAVNRLSAYYKNLKLVNGDELDEEQLKNLERYAMTAEIT